MVAWGVVVGLVVGLGAPSTAHAGLFGGRKPTEVVKDEIEEKKSEQELRAQERLAELEAAQSQKIARVVVLKWQNTDTDHTNEAVQRNIKARIARPDAKFFSEIDLYQSGRTEVDTAPGDQRAIVPTSAVDRVMRAVEDVKPIPWDALSDQDWGLKATELRKIADTVWFIDRVELREPMFLLYSQIGRAAENSNNGSPPYFEQIGDQTVNYYWYLAASLANEDAALMSKLTEPDVYASINNYKTQLDQGVFDAMTLNFELEAQWNAKAFASEYEVAINGIPRTITDPQGLYRANPGKVDIYLSRGDGHGLSERVELDKFKDKFYFVRDVARKKMGIDFIDQLMEHPNECSPEVDGDILNYLAIYAKLHGESEIYIVVPKGGSTASRNLYLWRWDRVQNQLEWVNDNTGGFPVRFAILVGAGITFNGATYQPATSEELGDTLANNTDPTDPDAGAQAALDAAQELPALNPSGLPIFYHLRGHFGRLLVTTGMEFAANLVPDVDWSDKYQTNSILGKDHQLTETELVPVDQELLGDGTCSLDGEVPPNGVCPPFDVAISRDVLRERQWQRLVFLGVGVVLGRNAAAGFGPRGYVRTGWTNTPHAVDLTGHLGVAAPLPFTKEATGRVRPVLDADFFGGIMIPFRDSVYVEGDKKLGRVKPTLGATVSAGTTF